MARTPGTAARRYDLETELRQAARELLALEAGAVATGPSSFMDLQAAWDYLRTIVQDANRKAPR